MNINLIGTMPKNGISGGRLLSWLLAESLAISGIEVSYITNNKPAFYKDFSDFSRVKLNICIHYPNSFICKLKKRLNIKIVPNILIEKIPQADYTVIVPQLDNVKLHQKFLEVAQKTSQKIVLLNFETPNWFNSLSPLKRDENRWNGWKVIAERADLILSISRESNKYAKIFYTKLKKMYDLIITIHLLIILLQIKLKKGKAEKDKLFVYRVWIHTKVWMILLI